MTDRTDPGEHLSSTIRISVQRQRSLISSDGFLRRAWGSTEKGSRPIPQLVIVQHHQVNARRTLNLRRLDPAGGNRVEEEPDAWRIAHQRADGFFAYGRRPTIPRLDEFARSLRILGVGQGMDRRRLDWRWLVARQQIAKGL